MIVDSSAMIALALKEPGYQLLDAQLSDGKHQMSTATWVKLGVVSNRRLSAPSRDRLEDLIDTLNIDFVPLSIAQARLARMAHRRYGPGSGSPARLTMGDCFFYALAIDLDEPLLFVGDGFTHTDVRRVVH